MEICRECYLCNTAIKVDMINMGRSSISNKHIHKKCVRVSKDGAFVGGHWLCNDCNNRIFKTAMEHMKIQVYERI